MQSPETGLLVPGDGPDELAAVVTELLVDRARLDRMGAAAREWVVARFDWELLSRRAQRLLTEAAGVTGR